MSKKLLFIITLYPMLALAQSQDQNYIKTTQYRDEHQGIPKVTITYFDGLGRPIQKIDQKQSGTGKNIVTHMEYDAFGRQVKEYLPLATSLNNLNFMTGNLPQLIAADYQARFNDSIAYSQKEFELSPLNRVLKQAAPGNDWKMGNGHEVKFEYNTNTVADSVRAVKVTTTWDSSLSMYNAAYADDGFYTASSLYKTITKDENWISGNANTTEEFKDKEGQVVLKRAYNGGKRHDTYYVYDDYGNLTYVLPPMVNITAVNQTLLDNMCYQYMYDHRNRLVKKKLPGKIWEYIAYNSQDKPVATGPVLTPFGGLEEGWVFTKYDTFGRVVYTGWKEASEFETDRVFIEAQLNGPHWYETFKTDAALPINIPINYTNETYPDNLELLTINYYDNYTYDNAPTNIPTIIEGQVLLNDTKGLPTGNWVRVLEGASQTNGNWSYTLYDKKGRPVRSHTDNYLGGFTEVDTKLDFVGKQLYTLTTHKRLDSDSMLTVREDYQYTAEDRLSLHTHKVNSLDTQNIALNSYDALGQLTVKEVGGTTTPWQKVNYDYNIRGWLLGINNINLLTDNDFFAFSINYNSTIANDENNAIVKLYNGNIAETSWRTSSDNFKRRYGYTYDHLNRLTNSVYQKSSGNSAMQVTHMYNEHMDYDKNGNIRSLQRNGDYDSTVYGAIQIDDLSYFYDIHNKNLLLRVTDDTNSPKGFDDDSDGTNDATDYSYDHFGNMVADENKNIGSIVYNHLNLPTQINFGGVDKIEYLYDATGQKQRKKVTEGTHEAVTDYLGGYHYNDTKLSFFPHAEGYVKPVYCDECAAGYEQRFNYVYQYKDHLGNIRVSYGLDPTENEIVIIEENHYYPFGLKHTMYNTGSKKYELDAEFPELMRLQQVPPGGEVMNKYKYNGKEYQDELGLNFYDYGARNYDPAIGRWMNIDPMAEKFYPISPYVYAINNPVYFIDPDGMEVIEHKDGTTYTGDDAKKMFMSIVAQTSDDGGGDSDEEPPVDLFGTSEPKGSAFHQVPKGFKFTEGDGVFSVFGHASSGGIDYFDENGKPQVARTAEEFDAMMSQKSEAWKQARKDGKFITLTFYACNVASEEYITHKGVTINREETFAEKVSKLPGVTVIAPDGYVNYGWRDGQPQITGVSNHTNSGGFLTFRNGNQVGPKTSLKVALIASQINATLKR